MKKLSIIALVLICSLSLLTACKTGPEGSVTPTPTGTPNTAPAGNTEKPTPTLAPTPTPASTPAPTETPNTPSVEGYQKGILTETDFASEYLDLRFTLSGDGFVMATEEDMHEMMGLGAEIMDMDSKLLEYAKLTTVYEMMVSTIDGTTNVMVFSEKLSMRNLTVEQYCAALIAQLEVVPNMDYEVEDEIVSVEVAGQSYEQVTTSTAAYGVTMVQKYLVRKLDDRIVGFIITDATDTQDAQNTLMEGFSKY